MPGANNKMIAFLMVAGCAWLGGCQVYLHDDALQKQTAAALTAYKQADVAGSIRATLAAQLALNQQMLDGIVAEDAASRDLEMANLLKALRYTDLHKLIADRLAALGGSGFVFISRDWEGGLVARDLARVPFDNQARMVTVFARRYSKAGGRNFVSCAQPYDLANGANAGLVTAHRQLAMACATFDTFRTTYEGMTAGFFQRACGTAADSLLARNCYDIKQADAQIAADEAAAAQVNSTLKAAKDAFTRESGNGTIDDNITARLKAFKTELDRADDIAGHLGGGSFQPSAVLAAIEFRKTNICDVLAASANASCSGEKVSDSAKETNQALVGVIAGISKLNGGAAIPDTDALSMALAHQAGLQGAALASLAGMRARKQLSVSEQSALVREVEYLLQARSALDGASRTLGGKECAVDGLVNLRTAKGCGADATAAVARALTAYNLSWADGRTPVRILESRNTMQMIMSDLEIAQANAAARSAVLTTALSSLDAFGQGGVTPQTIAEFLQALGVAAVANGVN